MEQVQRRLSWTEVFVSLAVVGILGIVIVPSYLEAISVSNDAIQRTHLQSIGAALELYKVDNAHYPPWVVFYPNDFPAGPNAGLPFHLLTTPINYASSQDIFVDVYLNARGYVWWRLQGTPGISCYSLGVSCMQDNFKMRSAQYLNCPVFRHLVTPLQSYVLQGAGPTQRIIGAGPCQSGTYQDVPYDPTNGAISNGHVYYFGPQSLSVQGWKVYE